tara:strand:- start:2094 stop:2420 length:327 start_codon:yes stop_codon:yes gene_type:complete
MGLNLIEFGKQLTIGQIEVLTYHSLGYTPKQIADEIGIKRTTVYSRFGAIREITQVRGNFDVVIATWTRLNYNKLAEYIRLIQTQPKGGINYKTHKELWNSCGLNKIP